MSDRTCRVCHKVFENYRVFMKHIGIEYRRFENRFGRKAHDWEEIVKAFNAGKIDNTVQKQLF